MKKISRNLWLKLAAFILCAVMICGLAATALVAYLTSYYSNVSGMRTSLFRNIAGSYSRNVLQDYLDGDDDAFSKLCDNTNMRIAVVKSKEMSSDKVDTQKDENRVYSSTSTMSNPDYIFRMNVENSRYYGGKNLFDAISYNEYTADDYEDSTYPQYIDTMAYSVETGLFYVYLENDETYIVPKIRAFRDTDNGTTSDQYKLAEKTDDEGNTYYEYVNVFSGEALSKEAYKSWYEVDCYDLLDNHASYYCNPAENNINAENVDIYVADHIEGDFKVLPEEYELDSDGVIYIPTEVETVNYYWVYVKMPENGLADKGDYFNQLDEYFLVMDFIEQHMALLFALFAFGFIITAGYLLTVAGKREEAANYVNNSNDKVKSDTTLGDFGNPNTEYSATNAVNQASIINTDKIKLRLYDRIPYEIIAFGTFMAEFALAFLCYVMLKEIVIVAMLVLIMVLIGLECLLSTYVRLRAHEFWKHTICYHIFKIILAPVKKVCKLILSPFRYAMSMIKNNTPLFVIGCVAFIGLCLLEVMGLAIESMAFLFFVKLIEFVMLITFIMQFDKIRKTASAIANGDFSHPIDTSKLLLFFKKHGEDLNNVSDGIEAAVSEKMKSERFRTELITNVSHDIKTPLTSIINYVDLLSKEDIDNENVREYLDVLNRQSARLKKLIEDLLEASKASTGSLKVELEDLDAAVMLSQIAGEYQEKFKKKNLDLMIKNDVSPVMIKADGRHLWRVFDNLMNNINKYAQPGTRVYVDIIPKEKGAVITFKNISECPLNISSEELMERFVRGDSSRNTEGSGLGLSIAESLMKLMNGTMKLSVDGDLFKVTLEF